MNPFVMKRITAIMIPAFLGTIGFYVGLVYYNFWIALLIFAVALAVSLIVSSLMLSNPFTVVLEGRGMLALDINSTGVITPFILRIAPPLVHGKLGGTFINTLFNRNAVWMLRNPIVNPIPVKVDEKTGITITLDEEAYNKGRFALFHYPVIIYNRQINSVITKEFFSEAEKTLFVEHNLMYLNLKLEELTSIVRDFGRYIVELTKPKGGGLFANKWFWIIMIGLFVLLGFLFAPKIVQMFQGGVGGATQAIQGAVSSPSVIQT